LSKPISRILYPAKRGDDYLSWLRITAKLMRLTHPPRADLFGLAPDRVFLTCQLPDMPVSSYLTLFTLALRLAPYKSGTRSGRYCLCDTFPKIQHSKVYRTFEHCSWTHFATIHDTFAKASVCKLPINYYATGGLPAEAFSGGGCSDFPLSLAVS